MNLKTGPQ